MNLQNCNIYNFTLSFKSSSRSYDNFENKNAITGSKIRTLTCLNRNDVDWNKLVQLVDDKFRDKKCINTYCVACSDGSEAYTYAIALNENLNTQSLKKYNRIIASDLDEESINAAKSGRINLMNDDINQFGKIIKAPLETYFVNKDKPIKILDDNICFKPDFYNSYKPTDKIKNMVEFKQSDMIEQLKTMKDDGNSVVLCRNVTPYLSENYRHNLIETLKNKMHDGSILVIGDFDRKIWFNKLLEQNDFGSPAFKEIDKNIFERFDPLGIADLYPEPELDVYKYLVKYLSRK